MSTVEGPSHYDLVTKTEVDPQSRTTNGKLLAPQHDLRPKDDLIVHADDNAVISLRDINDTEAKTRSLPPEILSIIFEFACPPIDFSDRFRDWRPGFDTFRAENNFHLILSAVCHYWREIVLSTPQLWTTITLRANRSGRSIQNATSLLNLYFERARAFPISIELDFHAEMVERHGGYDKEYFARLEPLKKAAFVDGASMIQHLNLIQAPTQWLPLVNENFSQCTSVAVFDPVELIEDENDESKEEGEKGDSDGESDEESDDEDGNEDNADNHDHEDELLLNLGKLPRLKRVDLVSVTNLKRFSVPIGATVRLRRSIFVYNALFSSLVSAAFDSLLESFQSLAEMLAQ